MDCLLCSLPGTLPFKAIKKPERNYFHCPVCDLIFMNPQEYLSKSEEKVRYDHHQNEDTEGYRRFLEPVVHDIEAFARLRNKQNREIKILDFGCGPQPLLVRLLEKQDFEVWKYDLFYFSDQHPLQKTYDVITSTEVWEHFHHPHEEIQQLIPLLKPQSLLVVMTSSHPGRELFQDWYYRRDLTHVTFFSERTMKWIAQHFGLNLIKAQSPYWIFAK